MPTSPTRPVTPPPTHVTSADSSGYDPKLKPESTTTYPSRGLRIESMEITDANNGRCNVLHQGDPFCVTLHLLRR